jgi:hypothetical protein
MVCCIVEAHGYECCCSGCDWVMESNRVYCAFCGVLCGAVEVIA